MTAVPAAPKALKVGGDLGAEHVYLERNADAELLDCCLRGEFVYILTSRQMGKSSLIKRAMASLLERGVGAAGFDLNTTIEQGISEERWYFSVLAETCRQFGLDETQLETDFFAHSHLSCPMRLMRWLEDVLLAHVPGPVVLFLDEVDATTALPFKDNFFAAVRALHNARASRPALARLAIVLVGATTPEQLIADPGRTPFNVGRGVSLSDFAVDQLYGLGVALDGIEESRRREILERVHYWTNGHPFMSVKTVAALAGSPAGEGTPASVDAAIDRLFLAQAERTNETHLHYVAEMLRDRRTGALAAYDAVLRGDRLERRANGALGAMLLSGVVVPGADGGLRVRNRIYADVFNKMWVARHLPQRPWREVAAAYLRKHGMWLVPTLASLALLLMTAATLLLKQRNDARDATESALAENIARLATAAALNESRSPDTTVAALLAIEGLWRKSSSEAGLAFLRSAPQLATSKPRFDMTGRSALSVAWSHDGSRLAFGGVDGSIWIVDSTAGRELAVLRKPNADRHDDTRDTGIRFVVWSPDDTRIASSSSDVGTLEIWDVALGQPIWGGWRKGQQPYPDWYPDPVKSRYFGIRKLAWSPDGHWLAVVRRGWIEILSSTDGTFSHSIDVGSTIRDVAWSPDSKRLAIADHEHGRVRLWDPLGDKELRLISETGWQAVASVSWRADGAFLAVGITGIDQAYVCVYRTADWEMVRRLTRDDNLIQNQADLMSVEDWGPGIDNQYVYGSDFPIVDWSVDGTHLAATTGLGTTIWREAATEPRTVAILAGRQRAVWNPTGSELGFLKVGGISFFELGSNQVISTIFGDDSAFQVAWSPDGLRLASTSERSVRIWDTRKLVLLATLDGHEEDVNSVAWSDDGGRIASASGDGQIQLWDSSTYRLLASMRTPPNDTVSATHIGVSWRPQGDLAVVGAGSAILSWDGSSTSVMHKLKSDGVLSPRGDEAVEVADRDIRVVDAVTGREVWSSSASRVAGHFPTLAAWSADVRHIATASSFDDRVVIRRTTDGGVTAQLQATGSTPSAMIWNPVSDHLAIGDGQGVIRIWHSQSRALLRTLEGHQDWIFSLAWSRDGQRLASSSVDGTIRIWDSWDVLITRACEGALSRNLTKAEWRQHFGPLIPYSRTCQNLPLPEDD